MVSVFVTLKKNFSSQHTLSINIYKLYELLLKLMYYNFWSTFVFIFVMMIIFFLANI